LDSPYLSSTHMYFYKSSHIEPNRWCALLAVPWGGTRGAQMRLSYRMVQRTRKSDPACIRSSWIVASVTCAHAAEHVTTNTLQIAGRICQSGLWSGCSFRDRHPRLWSSTASRARALRTTWRKTSDLYDGIDTLRGCPLPLGHKLLGRVTFSASESYFALGSTRPRAWPAERFKRVSARRATGREGQPGALGVN